MNRDDQSLEKERERDADHVVWVKVWKLFLSSTIYGISLGTGGRAGRRRAAQGRARALPRRGAASRYLESRISLSGALAFLTPPT